MLSGVLTSDSLTQAFRTLSQKRRHGILDIASPTGQVLIFFYNGKIIGAQSPERPFVEAVCDKLEAAEVISADLSDTLKNTIRELPELCNVLVGRNIVSKEHFLRAKRAYEMDVLYGLRKVQGGVFRFNSKIVEVDDSLALSVAPGQLLLDMLELDAAENRLEKDLKADPNADVWVVPQGRAAVDLSDEEAEVWRTLEITHCVREIRNRALLSEYQLTEALLGLLERRLIAPSSQEGSPVNGVAMSHDNPLGHMLEEEEEIEVKSAVTAAPTNERSQFNALIEEAASLLETGLDDLGFTSQGEGSDENYVETHLDEIGDLADPTAVEEIVEISRGEVAGAGAPSLENVASPALEAEVDESPANPEEGRLGDDVVRRSSLKELVTMSSVRLLDDDVLSRITLFMTIAFLLALGWVGPRMIDHWFQALEVFSSVN